MSTDIFSLSLHDALPISLRSFLTTIDCSRPPRRDQFAARLTSASLFVLGFLNSVDARAQVERFGGVVIGAQGIAVMTRESPAIHGRDLSEGYFTQPVVMAEMNPWGELLAMKATLNLEGMTIKRGELNA